MQQSRASWPQGHVGCSAGAADSSGHAPGASPFWVSPVPSAGAGIALLGAAGTSAAHGDLLRGGFNFFLGEGNPGEVR